ncbi:MAG: hypothetical protein ACR2N3_00950 [Pyrinomonadaceae bacterium]
MSALITTLQIFFSIVILIIGVELATKMIFPRSNLLKQFWRLIFRYALREPLKKLFRVSKWLIVQVFNTLPEYRLQQIYLENYPLTPLQFYQNFTGSFANRQVIGTNIRALRGLNGIFYQQGERIF